MVQDPRDVGIGLNIVDVGRFVPEAGLGRERGLQTRHSAAALKGLNKGGLLTTDKGAGALLDDDVAGKVGAHDVVSEKTPRLCVLDGLFQSYDGQRILCADVHNASGGANTVGTDEHALNEGVWVGLNDSAVHECTGVALVGVADEIFLVSLGVPGCSPLECGGEAGAAASAEACNVNLLNDLLLGPVLFQNLTDSGVAVPGNVLVDVAGVNKTAVPQRNAGLFLQEARVVVGDVDAVKKGEVLRTDGVIDEVCVFLLQTDEAMHLSFIIIEVYDGLQETHANTAGDAELHLVRVVFAEKLVKPGIDGTGTGGEAAASLSN